VPDIFPLLTKVEVYRQILVNSAKRNFMKTPPVVALDECKIYNQHFTRYTEIHNDDAEWLQQMDLTLTAERRITFCR
jgi:hypothetical protein